MSLGGNGFGLCAVTHGTGIGSDARCRTGRLSGNSAAVPAMIGGFGDGNVKIEAAVGGRLPRVASRTGCGTGSGFGNLIAVVCGVQLRQGDRSRLATL